MGVAWAGRWMGLGSGEGGSGLLGVEWAGGEGGRGGMGRDWMLVTFLEMRAGVLSYCACADPPSGP